MKSFSATAVQSNIFDFTPREATDDAVERAGKNADPEWSRYARICLKQICEQKRSLTVDDLCNSLKRYDVHTSNTSALGSIMRHGARMGWMKLSGEYVKSQIQAKHSRVIPVWNSLIYSLPLTNVI